MAEFSRKEASAAVILLIYMFGNLQGLRDNEIITWSSARCPGLAIPAHLSGEPDVFIDSGTKPTELRKEKLIRSCLWLCVRAALYSGRKAPKEIGALAFDSQWLADGSAKVCQVTLEPSENMSGGGALTSVQ